MLLSNSSVVHFNNQISAQSWAARVLVCEMLEMSLCASVQHGFEICKYMNIL